MLDLSKVQVGDQLYIERTFEMDHRLLCAGEIYSVVEIHSGIDDSLRLDLSKKYPGKESWWGERIDIEQNTCLFTPHAAISSPPSLIMSVVEFFKNKLRTPEDRSLIKAGFKDKCGDLTAEGKDALLYFLADQNTADLVKLADELVAEKEAEAAKSCKC